MYGTSDTINELEQSINKLNKDNYQLSKDRSELLDLLKSITEDPATAIPSYYVGRIHRLLNKVDHE